MDSPRSTISSPNGEHSQHIQIFAGNESSCSDDEEHILAEDFSEIPVNNIREKYLLKIGYCPLVLRDSTRRNSEDLYKLIPGPKQSIVYGRGNHLDRNKFSVQENKIEKGTLKWHFRPGSTVSSVFNLCSATLGAGALSLPYAIAKSGIVLGSLLLIIGALLTIYSIKLLIYCRMRTRLNSYEDLSIKLFSKRFAAFVELNIAIFCLGILVAYIIAAADIIHPLAVRYFSVLGDVVTNRNWLILILVGLIMLPLSFNEMVSSLRYASLIGVASIVYLVLAICGVSIKHLSKNGLPSLDFEDMFSASWDICLSIPIIMFAFTNQVNVFSIFTELHRPNLRRMKRVVSGSTLITFGLYFLIGIFGFLQNVKNTRPDILDNYDITQPEIAIAQIAVGITVILAFPINVFPLRFTIDALLFPNSSPSKCGIITRTTILVSIATAMALCIPKIDIVFALIGSFCSSLVCFILPGLFYLKINEARIFSREKFPALCLVIGGALVGIFCTGVTIWQVKEGY
jgi:amino acid permease